MRAWICLVLIAACNKSDGTRGECAEGGALADCPPAERTAEGACWRMVDCGAIMLKNDTNPDGSPNQYIFDWDNCVDAISSLTDDREQVVIDCIAESTCDALKTDDSPRDPHPDQMPCLLLGDTP